VLDAAEAVRDLPITFLFVGDGNARPQLEARVARDKLGNVRFLPPQPRERLSELLGACDVGLVPMKRGVKDDLVPSKLYGIMAAGRPVLASVEPESEVAQVVQRHGCGFAVAPEDGRALAEGVRRAFTAESKDRQRLGENGRAASEMHYSRKALTGRYEDVLYRAINARASAAQRRSGAIDKHRERARGLEGTWPTSR
jgi:colanic acid biosynthesis glycosyl transferase WcaI